MTYRAYIHFVEFFGGVSAYHNELGRGHIADYGHIVLLVKNGGGVRFFEVATEFCKRFGERNAHGYGESRFFFDFLAQLVCDLLTRAEKPFATRDVKPTLVYAETFHSVRVRGVNFKDLLGIFDVFVKMRGNEDDIGTFLLCRPQRFTRLNACFFCKLIFCKH